MKAAAVPAGKLRPTPLAALALVLATPVTFILADPESIARWLFNGQTGTALPGVPKSTAYCSD